MEGFFAAGCAFPCETTRPEKGRERARRGLLATHGVSKPIVIDAAGAELSAETRWRAFYHTLHICVKTKQNSASRLLVFN